MKIDDYFKEGLLKKAKVNKVEIEGSLKLARKFLERAKGNFKINYFDIAFILAYNAMFHTSRALLFSFGIKERSHFAMIDFLKEKLKGNKEIFNLLKVLDAYRISRHAIQYKGDLCSETDAEEAIKDAEQFLDVTETYLKKRY